MKKQDRCLKKLLQDKEKQTTLTTDIHTKAIYNAFGSNEEAKQLIHSDKNGLLLKLKSIEAGIQRNLISHKVLNMYRRFYQETMMRCEDALKIDTLYSRLKSVCHQFRQEINQMRAEKLSQPLVPMPEPSLLPPSNQHIVPSKNQLKKKQPNQQQGKEKTEKKIVPPSMRLN